MIISPRKRKLSPVAKLLSWVGLAHNRNDEIQVWTEEQFRFEMQKERSRVDRRSATSEFAVVLVQGISSKYIAENPDLVLAFRERLRITDSIGWYGSKLGLLLPDTDRTGAAIVAVNLEKVTDLYDLTTSIEIIVYPDDDTIANNSIEFQSFQFRDKDIKDSDSEDSFFRSDDEGFSPETRFGFSAVPVTVDKTFFSSTTPTPIWKRTIDIVGASAGLVLLSPVFLIAAIAVWFSSPGSIFFRQLREGKDGVPFFIYKFRTMCNDAETLKDNLLGFSEQDGPAFKLKNDPRLTIVGRYLRKSCIDELPQLLNILTGEMSLVGPRPLPINESFECLVWQRKRLEVTPGLTCIWQVRGGRNTQFADWMRMDMEYIRTRSLILDLKLILATVFVALLHRGSV